MTPLSRRALAAVFLSFAAAAFAATTVELHDPDMFHHLALGRELARRGLFAEEPFLYPLQGVRTGPPAYWLGSLAIYGWQALLGEGGLALLPALAGAVLAAVLLLDASPRSGRHTLLSLAAAALPLGLALAAFRYRATARPETFAVVFLALTLWAIRRFEDGRVWPLAALPALALLWTNVHPSLVAGLGLVGLFVVFGAAMQGWARATGRDLAGVPPPRRLALAALLLALAAAASLASPSPHSPMRSAIAFAAATFFPAGTAPAALGGGEAVLPYLRALVKELQPPEAADWARPHGLLLVLTAASFVVRGRRLRPRELVTFAVLAVFATRSQRFMILFAIVSAPFAARNLGEAVLELPEHVRRFPLRRAAAMAAVALGVAAIAVPLLAPEPGLAFGTGYRRGAYPVRAADYLQAIGFQGRVYNSFASGGYLSWRGVAPFQDGRGLLPKGFEVVGLLGPANRARFAELDAELRFDALVLARPEPVAGAAPLTPRGEWLVDPAAWSLVAFDDGGLLFLRRTGAHAALAARDEYRVAKPAYAPYDWPPDEVPALLEEYRRSVREAPACLVCRYFEASAALALGRADEALAAVAPVLGGDEPELVNAIRVAARASEALRKPDEARRLYERILATGLDDSGARRGLARLALAAGDARGALKLLRPALAVEPPLAQDLELGLEAARRSNDALETVRIEDRLGALRAEAAANALRERAIAAFEGGDVAGAVQLFRRAVETYEASPGAHSELGQAYLAQGRARDALWHQQRALQLDPKSLPAQFGLGLALAATGDRAGAAAAFQRCIDLEPSGVWAVRAAQQLRTLRPR